MKRVQISSNFIPEVVDVPEEYACCSVCGCYHPMTSYNNDNNPKSYERTNCYNCYMLPFEEMKNLCEKTKEILKSDEYKKLSKTIGLENHLRSAAVSKEKLLDILNGYMETIKKLPNDVLFVDTFHDDYNGSYLDKPDFETFKKCDCNYPYAYKTELDGKKIYYRNFEN